MKFAAISLATVLILASSADACSRCGFGGSSCRYSVPVVKQAAPVVQRSDVLFTQTYIFNNTAPSPIGGNTVYGYGDDYGSLPSVGSFAAFNAGGSKDLLLELARTNDNAGALAELADRQLERESNSRDTILSAQAILSVRESQSPSAAIVDGGSRTQVVRQTIRSDGTVTTERIQDVDAAAIRRDSPARPDGSAGASVHSTAGTVIATKCASCHGTNLTSPEGGLYLDTAGGIDPAVITESIRRITSDDPAVRMPKGQDPLSDDEKAALLNELLLSEKGRVGQ